ncbi:MAG: hypothetical protein LC768_12050 [Acidobacteria bacterium]|nr:hypothetical protein [Acidobacteriota bacterium]MCA1639043.1 hypothetical protein [Acidobacteriota bacterium]
MESSTIEGTWEEIQRYGSRLAGHRLRVTVLDQDSSGNKKSLEPNRKMSEVMRKIKVGQEDMRFTNGSKTQDILREARDGGMFGE